VAVLEGVEDDVAMTSISRRKMETYLVSPKNFRFAKVGAGLGKAGIPISGGGFTHSLRIDVSTGANGSTPKQVTIYFHRERTDRPPMDQVDVIDDSTTPTWHRTVKADWFKQFNAAFTNNWVNSHARYINRPHQSLLDIQFGIGSITVNFFNLEGAYDITTKVDVPDGKNMNGFRRSFLSKDFAIAMLQIADLPVIGEIEISLLPGYLRISYETEVGLYRVYIPVVKSNGERDQKGFTVYSMESIIPMDDMIDEAVAADHVEGE